MSFNKKQFRELIKNTLKELDLHSRDAVNLLMGTAAQESMFGTYLKQLGNGPALGVFQMEPATFKDIFENYLAYKPDLLDKVRGFALYLDADETVWNLKFTIIMARGHYLRVNEALPVDLIGYAAYWKKYYNTEKGAGTEQEFIRNYKKFVV